MLLEIIKTYFSHTQLKKINKIWRKEFAQILSELHQDWLSWKRKTESYSPHSPLTASLSLQSYYTTEYCSYFVKMNPQIYYIY